MGPGSNTTRWRRVSDAGGRRWTMPAAIAAVFSSSLRLLTFLPVLHTVEEDRRFIENVILKECEVIVAEGDAGIVSFLARHGEEIRLLYSHPDAIGSGAGSELLDAVKKSGVGALELWCFQANERGAPVLRGTRVSRRALHRRAGQRGKGAGRALPLGACLG